MKKVVKNIQASIRDRLKNKTKETNRPFSEILQYYGMERFLYRFSRSKYADKFILKGALMFTVWQVPERRTTLDIDFSARFDNQITQEYNTQKQSRFQCNSYPNPSSLNFQYFESTASFYHYFSFLLLKIHISPFAFYYLIYYADILY